MKEAHVRSIAKGVTWRFIASGTTMLVVFIVTGDMTLVASVGVVDVTLKVLFYYCHERIWGKIHWGLIGPEPKIPQ